MFAVDWVASFVSSPPVLCVELKNYTISEVKGVEWIIIGGLIETKSATRTDIFLQEYSTMKVAICYVAPETK